MKPVLVILAALAVGSAFATESGKPVQKKQRQAAPRRASEPAPYSQVPRWLEKKVKPIITKTVIARLGPPMF